MQKLAFLMQDLLNNNSHDDVFRLLRPGPIYRPDCPDPSRLDGRRLISLIKTDGVCHILRPDCQINRGKGRDSGMV